MIKFQNIRFKNIMSTGNAMSEVSLDTHASTIIVGTNGAGKSTTLDALCFALYGKPFRKVTLPLLINSINNKQLLTEVEFKIGKTQYMIRRGLKPKVFEVYKNGEQINEEASAKDQQDHIEKNILGMTFKSFCQIVVLGSSTFTPFMQLSTPDRRTVIEDLLDIQVFTKMNSVLKDKIRENKEALTDIEMDFDKVEHELNMLKKHHAEIRNMKTVAVDKINDKIETETAEIEEIDSNIEELNGMVERMQERITDLRSVREKQDECRTYQGKIDAKRSAIKKEVEFYQNHDDCPTCKQAISKDLKKEVAEERREEYAKLNEGSKKVKEKLAALQERLDEISKIQTNISEKQQQISSLQSSKNVHQRTIRSLNEEIEESKKSVGEVDESRIKELGAELDRIKTEKDRETAQAEKFKVASNLLKDGGIKAKIINQYIPVMNQLINQYLAGMELFVSFELDENFNETIKSRHRDAFTYFSFSEGEKMRIDLALLFTWREISRMRNSVSTNILFMDEVLDSSLDDAGNDDFLRIIREMTKGTNIFIISHKGEEYYDKFDRVIKVEKDKNFSYMEIM